MRLILARHGETECNRQKLVQGSGTDVELNHLGCRQAERLAMALEKVPITAVYASSMRRARATAEAVARPHSLKVVTDPDFREMDTGTLNGQPVKVMGDLLNNYFADGNNDASQFRMPGGESLGEIADRTWKATQRVVSLHPKGDVVVVSHHLVTLMIICRAMGLNLGYFRRMRMGVAAMSILEFKDGKAGLSLLNDTCHLDGLV